MHKPFLDPVIWTVALFLSGVAAGMFLMDFFGFFPVLPRLSPEQAIELYQQSLPSRRALFRVATASSGLASVGLIFFFSEGSARRLLIAQLLFVVALVLYTKAVLVPLNREIAAWNAAARPANWDVAFSKLITRERLRSFLPAAAFMLELIAFAVRKSGAITLR